MEEKEEETEIDGKTNKEDMRRIEGKGIQVTTQTMMAMNKTIKEFEY